jgi:hypothetical protein
MNARAKYWGFIGAAAGVLFSIAVRIRVRVAESRGDCLARGHLSRDGWWEAFFRTFEGDGGMMFIMTATVRRR